MNTCRVAAAALNQTPLDWAGNRRRAAEAIAAARDAGAPLVCLPELCLSGYGCEDAFFARYVREAALDSLAELAPSCERIAAVIGLPLEVDGALRNAAALVVDGRVVGFSLKQHLANDGIHYEARWFQPWPAGEEATVSFEGESVPAGDLVYDFRGVRVGVEVCRDAWVADRPAHRFADRGVSLVLNPSASHFAFGKQAIRARLVREGAAAVGGAYVYANLLGNEAGRAVYDGGALFATTDDHGEGQLVAAGARFAMTDHAVTVVDLPIVERPAPEADADVAIDHALDAPPAPIPEALAEAGPALASKHEEFSRVVPLALVDYLRKSGAKGFVLSLSGGADSGAVATLVWLLAKLGIEQLGAAGLAARLPRVAGLDGVRDPLEAVGRLLTTVYQATENSSETTRDAAESLATALGATHHEWGVDPVVEACRERVEAAIGRPLSWETDDIALQNVQSRSRSPAVWMLANVLGGLLLTTGNRSEASVGYATMDGDTSGGFAPLAGVDKAYLLEWLRWMEQAGPAGIGPLPELAAINAQQPTAELRPLEAGQTDEADLMPYPVLDAIERSAIGALEPRGATLARLQDRFPDLDREQLAAWVDRFWTLWRASQWKRERIAPGLHLDTLSVDPKTWRRWPILSGPDAGRAEATSEET